MKTKPDDIEMKDDGGPAFPATPEQDAQGFCGMTLRDYFAAHALMGMRAGNWSSDECARLAYRDADAMLRLRNSTH